MLHHIFFDFDGTLVDTGPGVKACVCDTLSEFGYPIPEDDVLNQFLGPPLEDSFSQFCGLSGAEVQVAVRSFRARYNESGLWNSLIYPGVTQGLKRLKDAGAVLYIVSSKPRIFVVHLLERYALNSFFSGIEAAPISGKSCSKEMLLRAWIARNELPVERCCMVGDRKFDIDAARQLGLSALAVSYGYGTLAELHAAHPNWIAPSFEQAVVWILNQG